VHLGLSGEQLADERNRGSGIVSTSTSPASSCAIAAWTMRLSSCPQRTVRAGPAARDPATIWMKSASTHPRRPPAS
jgi:hypothetical protein